MQYMEQKQMAFVAFQYNLIHIASLHLSLMFSFTLLNGSADNYNSWTQHVKLSFATKLYYVPNNW